MKQLYDLIINARVTQDIADGIDKLADKYGVRRSDIVRMSVVFFLEKKGLINTKQEGV